MSRNRKAGGRGCSVGVGLRGHENVLELDRYRHTVVKPLNATELFTVKWLILCYVKPLCDQKEGKNTVYRTKWEHFRLSAGT